MFHYRELLLANLTMRRTYLILRTFLICSIAIMLCLALLVLVLGAIPQWFARERLPLGSIRGTVFGNDAVYVASSTAGRIYKFSLNGDLLDWIDIHGRPIWITRQGNSIMVHYSGREWAIEDPAFRVQGPITDEGTIEHTWCGQPLLVANRLQSASKISLQPWYLTAVQSPWPGLLYGPLLIVMILVAFWAHKRIQTTSRQAVEGAPDEA